MTAPMPCPQCGGTLEIVTDGLVSRRRTRGVGTFSLSRLEYYDVWEAAPFAACCACEFCIEIKTDERK